MPSLPSTALGQMSVLPWSEAISRVARVLGGTSDPDLLGASRDFLRETLQDWETRREWRYLNTIADDIAVVSGTQEYDLPSAFKKPYTAYLSGSFQPLGYIERYEWDKRNSGLTSPSTPCYYTLYNYNETGQVALWPSPSVNDTLKVLYIRAITHEGADDVALDIPARWEGYILAGARYRLLGSKEGSEKASFWGQEYERGFLKAVADDGRIPDAFLAFTHGGFPAGWAPNRITDPL